MVWQYFTALFKKLYSSWSINLLVHIISGKINFYSTHPKKSAFYDFNENMIK